MNPEQRVQKPLDRQKSTGSLAKKQGRSPEDTITVILSCVLIIILGLAAYGNSLQGKFLWDDEYHVKQNAYIRSTANLPNILTQDLGAGSGRPFGFYRPLQVLTYVFDYSFWKLDPFGYHLTNMLLHIFTGLALYLLVRTIYGGMADNFIPLVTSVLYIVYPAHTGAISYVSGRADPLAASFLLLSLAFYIRNLKNESAINYFVFLSSYILALLSKEYALIFIFILLLYHYSFRKKIRLVPIASIASIAIAYIFLRITVLCQVARVDSSMNISTTLLERLPGFFAALTSYARLMLLPINLHVEYGTRLFNPLDPVVILGALILTGLIGIALKKKDDPTIVFGVGWFLITLFPMSNIYPINAYMAEHWLYFPSIGMFLIFAKEADLLRRLNGLLRWVTIASIALLAALWLGMTARQNTYWRDPVSFFERTLKYAPDSAKMHNDIGRIYAMSGTDNEKAEKAFKKAIEVNPKYPLSYNNLGFLYYGMGRKDEAAVFYKKALELDPFYTDALNNLANIYVEKGMNDDAIRLYKKALETHPNSDMTYSNLGTAYLAAGRNDDAEYSFSEAIRLNPQFGDAYFNLAILYARTGRPLQAEELYQKAAELNPRLKSQEFLNRLKRKSQDR